MQVNISQSAATKFLQCEQQYYYAYVQGLERNDRQSAPELGTTLHDYLMGYYRGLYGGMGADEAHNSGMLDIVASIPRIRQYVELALMGGADQAARALAAIPKRALRIAEWYFEVRGHRDAQDHEVLLCEQKLRVQLTETVYSTSRIDLVTRHRGTGMVYLWEHKSTENPPKADVHLWDLQTVLYAEVLQTHGYAAPDAVMWNYLRTIAPTVPEPLKQSEVVDGVRVPKFSRARDIDTTWDVYKDALVAHGIDPTHYVDVASRLTNAETRIFFPRHEQIVRADASIILRDYIETGNEIERKRKRWATGDVSPIRTLSRNCQWCDFKPMCLTVLTGGDETTTIEKKFIRRQSQGEVSDDTTDQSP